MHDFQLIEDSQVVMVTFGGKQVYTMHKGARFFSDFVVATNTDFTVFQSGLNYYIFSTKAIPPEVLKGGYA